MSFRPTVLDATSGNETRGHRFHAPRALRIAAPARLRSHAGEARQRHRRFRRAPRAHPRTASRRWRAHRVARALVTDALLDEVTALVEWPVPLAGRFEERFLSLPRELLISVLQDHQRYFPVAGADGRLLPWFITVSNIESTDPDVVRAGNERVVRPRLADAAFFWEQDRKSPLAARVPQLDAVTFQAQLGSIGDKVRRIAHLAREIAARIDGDESLAARAAQLAKCDLVTNLVGEFPELQGIMGDYSPQPTASPLKSPRPYASTTSRVAPAMPCPTTQAGLAVALADRSTRSPASSPLASSPRGTKDPFALRRAAIGIGRMIYEKRLPLDLVDLIDESLRAHTVFELPLPAGAKPLPSREAVADASLRLHDGAAAQRLAGAARWRTAHSRHHARGLRCRAGHAAALTAGFRCARCARC